MTATIVRSFTSPLARVARENALAKVAIIDLLRRTGEDTIRD